MESSSSVKSCVVKNGSSGACGDHGYLLVRDDMTKALVVVGIDKVSAKRKKKKLSIGDIVAWQNSGRERWRGPVLVIGDEEICVKSMSMIEKKSAGNHDPRGNEENKENEIFDSSLKIDQKDINEDALHDGEGIKENEVVASSVQTDHNEFTPVYGMNAIDGETRIGEKNEPAITDQNSPQIENRKRRNSATEDSHVTKKFSSGFSVAGSGIQQVSIEDIDCHENRKADSSQQWMRRPTDPKIIRYLMDMFDLGQGKLNAADVDRDQISEIGQVLGMSENQLLNCRRNSATRTVRQIMRFKYPNPDPNFKLRDVSAVVVNAIMRYTNISNKTNKSSEQQLRTAMRNYFALVKYKHKLKQTIISTHLTEHEKKSEIPSGDDEFV